MTEVKRLQWGLTSVTIGIGCFDHIASDNETYVRHDDSPLAVFCGHKAMRESGFLDSVIAQFAPRAVEVFDGIGANPSIDNCQKASDFLVATRPAAILALGGGSVIDTAKVANIAAATARPVHDLLHNPSQQEALRKLSDIFIVVPTTAGTGSEVTPFATVWDFDAPKKHSLTSSLLNPTHVYLDARLTGSLSRAQTQDTAGDALGHAMESIWSKSNLFFTQALAGEAIRLIVKTLPDLLNDLYCLEKRHRMLWASLLAGMAISQTRTAAAHAISYPLTLEYGIPHGRAVGALLPHVLAANLHALDAEQVELLCRCFDCDGRGELVGACRNFLEQTGITEPLSNFGVRPSDVTKIARESNAVGRIDNNIYNLSREEIETIISAAL